MNGAIAKAEDIYNSAPKHYLLLQQFKNPANPDIHFRTTARKSGTTRTAGWMFW